MTRKTPSILDDPRYPAFVRRYHDDPLAFAMEVTNFEASFQQMQLISAMRESNAKVSVVSGTGSGKTVSFGRLALWHLLCFPVAVYDGGREIGSNTYIGAPNIQQVADGVWKAMEDARMAMQNGRFAWLCDYFEITKTKVFIKGFSSQWFISQIAFQQGKSVGIAGKHRYWQLIIIDEAAGVTDEHFNVIEGTQTQKGNRTLMASQGVRNAGRFYDSHHTLAKKNGGSWTTLCFDSELSPWVTKQWLLERALESGGVDSIEYRVRVKGEFVEDTSNVLMTRVEMDKFFDAGEIIAPTEEFGYLLLGDVGMGQYRDDSVLVVVKVSGFGVSGFNADRKIEVIAVPICTNSRELMDFAGDVMNEMNRYSNASLYMDAGGVGAGVINAIEKSGIPVNKINWGNPCFQPENKKRFYNQRAQAMVCLKEAIRDGRASFRADVSQRLKQKIIDEGMRLPYHFSEAGSLRYVMDAKEDMRKSGIKSPDLIDAISFAFLENVTYMVADDSYANSISQADKTLLEAENAFKDF